MVRSSAAIAAAWAALASWPAMIVVASPAAATPPRPSRCRRASSSGPAAEAPPSRSVRAPTPRTAPPQPPALPRRRSANRVPSRLRPVRAAVRHQTHATAPLPHCPLRGSTLPPPCGGRLRNLAEGQATGRNAGSCGEPGSSIGATRGKGSCGKDYLVSPTPTVDEHTRDRLACGARRGQQVGPQRQPCHGSGIRRSTGATGIAALADFRGGVRRPVLFDRDRAHEVAAALPELSGELIAAADRAEDLRFTYFGYEEAELSEPIDWNLDPVSGVRWPDLPPSKIDYRTPDRDVKWIWELNRLQHLPWLAQAWLLTGTAATAKLPSSSSTRGWTRIRRGGDRMAQRLRSWHPLDIDCADAPGFS